MLITKSLNSKIPTWKPNKNKRLIALCFTALRNNADELRNSEIENLNNYKKATLLLKLLYSQLICEQMYLG
nr:hypothetical protein [Mycoplasmopsis bovis]